MNYNILGIIPARGGSKGVIDKNIKLLNSKPLISFTIESAKKAKLITKTIVSTDSSRIADIAKEYGCEVPFIRPKELATDSSLTVDVVIHCLNKMKSEGINYDYVVVLQPTTPLRTPKLIDESINLLIDSGCDSVVSFVDVGANHPFRMYTIIDGSPIPLLNHNNDMTPRQELPKFYIRSGDIYAFTTDFIIKNRQLMGGDCRSIIVDSNNSINIDNENDFLLANLVISKR